MEETDDGGIRAKGEEALGELAQALLENPLFSQAVGRALGAVDIASAGDLTRLSKRIRALSDRLETVEDTLDTIARDVAAIRAQQESEAGSKKS